MTDYLYSASLVARIVKNLPAMQETQVRSLGWEDPMEKEVATHSNQHLPRQFCEQRSLVGYSPWCHKDSDRTDQLTQTNTNYIY